MEKENFEQAKQQHHHHKVDDSPLTGFSPVSAPRIFWKSRKRSGAEVPVYAAFLISSLSETVRLDEGLSSSTVRKSVCSEGFPASGRNLDVTGDITNETPTNQEETPNQDMEEQPTPEPVLSERRKSLFEPLEPANGKRKSAESLLPPPDFDSASYPKGWLIGKKRKLVNVDVVESMRRIAVQEINRKDREINGLNEQLEEDARCLEHLQLQLLQERSKRSEVERENAMLQDQINMLMDMFQENETMGDQGPDEP